MNKKKTEGTTGKSTAKPVKKKLKPEAVSNTVPVSETAAAISSGKVFPVVGVGASAGGMKAFQALLAKMPAETSEGIALVFVQHLAPDQESILSEILRRFTKKQVLEIENGMKVEPDCIYVIPPGYNVALRSGALVLVKPSGPRLQHMAVDYFFRSLAAELHEKAICIILSGTGSDGTLGMRAIKAAGGMVMVQSSKSSEYDGMPRNAIGTGLADYVLAPEDMPAVLINYLNFTIGETEQIINSDGEKKINVLKQLFIMLRNHTGNDFSGYKQNMVIRRIERRMAIHSIKSIDEYLLYLQKNKAELVKIFQDLLIGVTNFFRDPEAFSELEKNIIPDLFLNNSSDIVRIWVCACSTGEEAYSIAILVYEYLEAIKKYPKNIKIQIFATDIDNQSLEIARKGSYPVNIAADVTPERLKKFFTKENNGKSYCINKKIREMIIFSAHNIIKDPPFSKMDLISCRNLLIYLNPEQQKKLLLLFHYSLKPGGFLFLGSSEKEGGFQNLFSTKSGRYKMYQRKENGKPEKIPLIENFTPALPVNTAKPNILGEAKWETNHVYAVLIEKTLQAQYQPALIMVNPLGEILYLQGNTRMYLELRSGGINLNILKMSRSGLRQKLRFALDKVVKYGKVVSYPGLKIREGGKSVTANLTVRKINDANNLLNGSDLFLVILEEVKETANEAKKAENITDSNNSYADKRIRELKNELKTSNEELQINLEETETSNEELKSINEEMQSMNEELQFSNEELETSREELQSGYEKLNTVNKELKNNISELLKLNDDMNNLLSTTGMGTIFVDTDQKIKRFTSGAARLINLIEADVGRPLGHFSSKMRGYNSLEEDIRKVLGSLLPKEIEVQGDDDEGAWYLLRIQPYRSSENLIEGALITFTDINNLKKMQEALQETESIRRLAVLVRDSNDAIIMQDLEGRIMAWNPCAVKLYGWSEAEALKMNIDELIPEEKRKEILSAQQRQIAANSLEPYKIQRLCRDGKIVNICLTISVLLDDSAKIYAISTTERLIKND